MNEKEQLLRAKALQSALGDYTENWSIIEEKKLQRTFTFSNFNDALKKTCEIGEVAEKLGHHPDIYLSWGKVVVQIWTHSVDGITFRDIDFIKAVEKSPGNSSSK